MKNLIITAALILLSTILSCKKSGPNGGNFVKYKLNGMQYEISGPYRPYSNTGVGVSQEKNNQIGFGAHFQNGDNLIFLCNVNANTYLFDSSIYDSNIHAYGKSPTIFINHKYQLEPTGGIKTKGIECKYQSGTYTITHNTPEFISGTFQGKVYDKESNVIVDSFIVSEGYFDIAK
jgi:hypothetical protein